MPKLRPPRNMYFIQVKVSPYDKWQNVGVIQTDQRESMRQARVWHKKHNEVRVVRVSPRTYAITKIVRAWTRV